MPPEDNPKDDVQPTKKEWDKNHVAGVAGKDVQVPTFHPGTGEISGLPGSPEERKESSLTHNKFPSPDEMVLRNFGLLDYTTLKSVEVDTNVIRAHAAVFAGVILRDCPSSRERSLAFTKLEEAMFWANAAIGRNKR